MEQGRSRAQRWRELTAQARRTGGAMAFAGGMIWRHARFLAIIIVALSLVGGVAQPLLVWAMTGLINVLAALPANPWREVVPWLGVLFAAYIVPSIRNNLTLYCGGLVRERLKVALQRRLLEHMAAVPLTYYEQPEYYHKLENGWTALSRRVSSELERVAGQLSALLGTAGLLALYAQAHWLLPVVLAATSIASVVIGGRQGRRFVAASYARSPLRREERYWAQLLADRGAAPELRLFGLGAALLDRWRAAFNRHLDALTAAHWRLAWESWGNTALQELTRWGTAVALLVLASQGQITLGSLVALLYALGPFRNLIQLLSYNAIAVVDYYSRWEHLRDFLAVAPEPRPDGPHPAPPRPLREGVQFHRVSFTYPGAARPALQDVSLTLRPQERIALVGENGAGKTTLVRLLLGLYRPSRGRITVDGIDLNDLDPAAWRREATAIFQDFMRYPATALENIGYGDTTLLSDTPQAATMVPAAIERAAAQSGADGFIASLPDGYATLLRKEFVGGMDLSTGQWQRLAIARAYVRDAQIIVLDEPTAALDPRAEVAVYRQFRAAAAGRCAVFISHRLGSARLADRIIVLQGGRIVEEGDHATLVQGSGAYARLYGLQASWYAADDGPESAGQ